MCLSTTARAVIYQLYLGENWPFCSHVLLISYPLIFSLSFALSPLCLTPPSPTHTNHHGDGRWREGLSPALWKCRQNTTDVFLSSCLYYLISPPFTLFSNIFITLHNFQSPGRYIRHHYYASFHSSLFYWIRLYISFSDCGDKDRRCCPVNEIHPRPAVSHSVFILGDDVMSSTSIMCTHKHICTDALFISGNADEVIRGGWWWTSEPNVNINK